MCVCVCDGSSVSLFVSVMCVCVHACVHACNGSLVLLFVSVICVCMCLYLCSSVHLFHTIT